ncbi:MAG: hypothetical protein WCZ47_03805 [Bacilli bacterium]|jgi:vacuolar-type H+-ATPase subunit C/Vma6|nr:hypothetical protein [Bacilli bacterium]NLN80426.1 V-type ATPase subunit [Erysipelotrichia bacterium]
MVDYTFASAYLGTKQSSLLSKEHFLELRKVSDENFVLKLHSFGYGLGHQNSSLHKLVDGEILHLKKELLEVVQNDQLVMIFFTNYDLVNIRSFYKKKLFQIKDEVFIEAGFIKEKVLRDAFVFDDYTNLIEPYKTLLLKTNEKSFNNVNELATYLQLTFQDLLYEKIIKSKDQSLLIYFQMSTDISNLLTMLRFRKMKLKMDELSLHLLTHGTLEVGDIKKIAGASDDELFNKFANLYMGQFAKPLEEALKTHDHALLEQRLLLLLIEELKPLEINLESSAAIIKYVILKQIEVIDLRRLYANRDVLLMSEIK